MIGTTSSSRITIATALATGQSRFSKNSSDSTRPIMIWSVRPRSVGMTYSPTAGMNTRSDPATMPAKDCGSVTRTNARNGRAPRSAAASSSVPSCFSRLAYSGRIMNGRYEYTIPMYTAKSVCSSASG